MYRLISVQHPLLLKSAKICVVSCVFYFLILRFLFRRMRVSRPLE